MKNSRRIWLLTATVGAAGLATYFTYLRDLSSLDGPIRLSWWALAIMFLVAEVFVVHLQFRRDAMTVSMSEIPLVLGLFFAAPGDLVIGQVLGGALGLLIFRRQPPIKAAFNASQFLFSSTLAVIVFRAIADTSSTVEPRDWGATFAATIAAGAFTSAIIGLAIYVSEGRLNTGAFVRGLKLDGLSVATNTSLGLVGATTIWFDRSAGWLLLVPATILFFAYRVYMSQQQKHESLELLYESSRKLQHSLQVESSMLTLLSQAQEMFRAERSEVILFPTTDAERALVSTLGPGDHAELLQPIDLDPKAGVWARIAAEDQGLLLAKPITNERIRRYFERRGIWDAMVAPLHEEERVVGTIMVANRLGDVATFDKENLRLFETLANHQSVALANTRLIVRLEDSLAHLTEINRQKDDFVASVSHELRTPLTSIQGYVKTLLRTDVDFEPDQRRRFLETIDRQSERLRTLIEDLLVVARLEAQKDQLVLTSMSLSQLALQVVEELKPRSREHKLHLDFDEELPPVETDNGKVHQILSNLVDNALKYTPEGTRITIAGAEDADGVIVSVIDEGPGIPIDKQEKVFDRFYQVDQSTTRPVGGTGLGLYICRMLAETIDAKVWLERSDERGSVFNLKIPFGPHGRPARIRSEEEGPGFIVIEGGQSKHRSSG